MSTNAYITLHNISNSLNGHDEVTFYRHCDGYIGAPMAEMFYQFFNNALNAKGIIERMICSDPSQIEIDSFEPVSKVVCNSEFHYHLDLKTLELIVLNHEWWSDEAEVKTVFKGNVDEFINTNTDCVKSIISRSEYNQNEMEVFTKDSMIRAMFQAVEVLNNTIKNPSNPNNKTYTKRLDRFDVFLSDMNLTKEERLTRSRFQSFNLLCQAQMLG